MRKEQRVKIVEIINVKLSEHNYWILLFYSNATIIIIIIIIIYKLV